MENAAERSPKTRHGGCQLDLTKWTRVLVHPEEAVDVLRVTAEKCRGDEDCEVGVKVLKDCEGVPRHIVKEFGLA